MARQPLAAEAAPSSMKRTFAPKALLGTLLLTAALFLPCRLQAALPWTPLVNLAPDDIELMLLLTDGTVMAASGYRTNNQYGSAWYRLVPDSHGSYVNGTWTNMASMNYTRLWYSSTVLRDGGVFVAGGEYGTGAATAEIYEPLANSWTIIPVPTALLNPALTSPNTGRAQGFIDSMSKYLPNGNVLVAPVSPGVSNGTLIYNPGSSSWAAGPASSNWLCEAGWVRLPDGSFLTVDPGKTTSERYIPSLNQWISDATVPTNLYYLAETGPSILLPGGKAFFFGGTGHTAIYTPSGSTAPGSWVVGPDVPGGLVAADAPAAMMVNGKVLCDAALPPYVDGFGQLQFPTNTSFFEYDPVGNSFAQVNGPTNLIEAVQTFGTLMLALPDGTVLYSEFNRQLYVYQPSGPLQAAGKPTLTSLVAEADGSFHLTGTLFNGNSEGAAYGDDAQMDSNYPLVRLTNGSGNVFYCRTTNWSTIAVMTGATPVTTDFRLPATLTSGQFSLVVIANGFSSDPLSFTPPVWVDFNYTGTTQLGTYDFPFQRLTNGVTAVPAGGSIFIKTAGHSAETMRLTKAMTLLSPNGTATIGR
jgi:hypothetical protein